MRSVLGVMLCLAASSAVALDCSSTAAPAPAMTTAVLLAPAPGLDGSAMHAPAAVFDAPSADLTVGAVLRRMRDEQCAQPEASAAGGYQKQTEFDNTPYRFNMKPGQKLSADEFDAWMASRGIRIVKARDEAAPATVDPTLVAPAAATTPVVAE